MRYSILVKFLVILLAACSLTAAIGGAAGIIAMESAGLYVNGLELLQDQEYRSIAEAVASGTANRYAAKNLSNLRYTDLENQFPDPKKRGDAEHWRTRLCQEGEVLIQSGVTDDFTIVKEYTFVPVYPIVSIYAPDYIPPETTDPSEEERNPSAFEIIAPEGYLYSESDTVWEGTGFTTYYHYFYEAPEYTVTVYMRPGVLESSSLHLLTDLYPHRYTFVAILATGLLLFAAGMVYLLWVAGRTGRHLVRPGGLNRLPVDLYGVVTALGIYALIMLMRRVSAWVEYEGPHLGNLSILSVNLIAILLLGIGFLFCLSAQVKLKGFLWQQSLFGKLCRAIKQGLGKLFRTLSKFFALLPVIWQSLLVLCICLLGCILTAIPLSRGIWLPFAAMALFTLGIICYGAWAYGTLLSGVRHMALGDLTHKIETRYLAGALREQAKHINALANVATNAAEKQMYSERMRTELITNISHDIKTPLTSIINYVDLLGRPHSDQEGQQYLEVLGRQSQRMKKLIVDLVELSKVSSGNVEADITQLDAVEAVTQALGEFSDKLAYAKLEPVFTHPEETVTILADGRLLWRVLSNLFSNAVKYAMPDTRLYVDLLKIDGCVQISLKNVSREPLNVSAEELTERFVRGDTARKTEGSGLGLNIAKSLMELQAGHLQILVDGDLFKVTLTFPGE